MPRAARAGARGTGRFIFEVQETQSGNITRHKEFTINILEEDFNVVVRHHYNGTNWKKWAKVNACRDAAFAVVKFALIPNYSWKSMFSSGNTLESLKKKPDMPKWRRRITCDWVRSGRISGIDYRDRHRMSLIRTRVEAVGLHKDSGHRETDSGTIKENYMCWEDSRAKRTGGASGPTRDDPDR